jgi:hypothetical protein
VRRQIQTSAVSLSEGIALQAAVQPRPCAVPPSTGVFFSNGFDKGLQMKAIRIGMLSLVTAVSFASSASAAECRLHQPWSPVGRGTVYAFGADIPTSWGGTIPYPSMPLTVYWQGTKNGMTDVPPNTVAITTNSVGYHDIGKYTNPWSGAWAGTYDRWIVVKDSQGRVFCTSNVVRVVLL